MWVMMEVGGAIRPGERGWSSMEAFPGEVASQEVEYEMRGSVSQGRRDITGKGTRHAEPRERSRCTFSAWPWLSRGVAGGRAGEALAFGSGLTSKAAGKLRSVCSAARSSGVGDSPSQLLA